MSDELMRGIAIGAAAMVFLNVIVNILLLWLWGWYWRDLDEQ